ncbi:hypothetical protein [Sphingomonas hankyongi]|uniref:Uncharacterized protein n=1 Tax=Sphingomonas hankyongi TaxID=2908209 RepID=A0ABT0S1K3_9SPHN|nr:hypothetical protein [Sphingomonas hankyongi]MCL6729750.1 hypothetical protein [Sphingomonas hankyongi]
MKSSTIRSLSDPLARRDIVAICVYLNRTRGTKAVDACVTNPGVHLDRLTAAARMQ